MKNDSKRWLSSREACRIIGVRPKTLREWDKAGKIRTKRTPGKHRRYDVSSVPGVSKTDIGGHRKNFIYARVSSQKQKNDLERQIQFCLPNSPDTKLYQTSAWTQLEQTGPKRLYDSAYLRGINGCRCPQRQAFKTRL